MRTVMAGMAPERFRVASVRRALDQSGLIMKVTGLSQHSVNACPSTSRRLNTVRNKHGGQGATQQTAVKPRETGPQRNGPSSSRGRPPARPSKRSLDRRPPT
ncbi:hypothetical protein GCM10023321_43710 [Pseudonocardia eucalypti]|uniref:Transposase n=1 Tax=Pseudonocardia eucalypti TaxID=648755 RepID=A0ABP9QEQ2_9PSEU